MKNELIVIAKVSSQPGFEELLRVGLLELVERAKTEPGFIRYDLHVSKDDPGEFLFYEIWESERDLNVHNNTDSMKLFGKKAESWIKSVTLEKYALIS